MKHKTSVKFGILAFCFNYNISGKNYIYITLYMGVD